AGDQAGNFSGPLPARHPLSPDQRVRSDHAPGNEVAQLGLRIRALLLATGCIKPRSVRHFCPLSRVEGESRRDGWRWTRILADDPTACTVIDVTSSKCFPLLL